MSAEQLLAFVDTNVLVYAHDTSAGAKHERARRLMVELWQNRCGCLSTQVLAEFYVTLTRKVARPLDGETAVAILEELSQWRVHTPRPADVMEAARLQQRIRTSFWDALIIWSAASLGCRVLWSEDLKFGQEYAGVRVLNPFAEAES